MINNQLFIIHYIFHYIFISNFFNIGTTEVSLQPCVPVHTHFGFFVSFLRNNFHQIKLQITNSVQMAVCCLLIDQITIFDRKIYLVIYSRIE